MVSEPPYAVIVKAEGAELEELRNYAYASAQRGAGSSEHWEENRGLETAFFFISWEAAFLFNWHCEISDVPHRMSSTLRGNQ